VFSNIVERAQQLQKTLPTEPTATFKEAVGTNDITGISVPQCQRERSRR